MERPWLGGSKFSRRSFLPDWKNTHCIKVTRFMRNNLVIHRATTTCKSSWDYCTVFWRKWPVHDLVLVILPPPLIRVASNTRPYSKLGGTTLNGRQEGGQYYILQTCDQERFEAWKVVFSLECLNIFTIGSSIILCNYHYYDFLFTTK